MTESTESRLAGIASVREQFGDKIPAKAKLGTDRFVYTKNKRSESESGISHVCVIEDKVPSLIRNSEGEYVDGNNKIVFTVNVGQLADHDLSRVQKAISAFLAGIHAELQD